MPTLPKLAVDGMADNWPCVPVPLKETVRGEFDALLEMEALPVTAPGDCGANCICTVTLWPTVSENDVALVPTALNPAPVMDAFEAFTVAVPVFVIEKLSID